MTGRTEASVRQVVAVTTTARHSAQAAGHDAVNRRLQSVPAVVCTLLQIHSGADSVTSRC